MKINKLLKCVALLTVIGASASVQAAPSVCNRLGGDVIVSDAIYGASIGAAISGLVMVVDDNYDNSVKKLGTGALIGLLAGVALGATELANRDCATSIFDVNPKEKRGWQNPEFYFVKVPTAKTDSYADQMNVKMTYRFDG